jgi:hypothetical protein
VEAQAVVVARHEEHLSKSDCVLDMAAVGAQREVLMEVEADCHGAQQVIQPKWVHQRLYCLQHSVLEHVTSRPLCESHRMLYRYHNHLHSPSRPLCGQASQGQRHPDGHGVPE